MSLPATSEDRMSQAYPGASPNSRLLAGAVSDSKTTWQSYAQRTTWSVLTHMVALGIIVYLVSRVPAVTTTVKELFEPPDITWIAGTGDGGGGGGGGNKTPEPPRKAEITPPKTRVVEPPKPEVPKPDPPQMNIPAVTSVVELPGAISKLPDPTQALGMGTGGGGGTGTGTGVGSGQGSGLGPGSGGGFGDGVYRDGASGVTSPVLVRDVKPNYTGEAMRARIQGMVTMHAVVQPDGSVGNVQIVKSLDQTFGLDQEAVATVKKWRFKPGLLRGQPVAVLIVIEMSFTLR
jgi:protein TonB